MFIIYTFSEIVLINMKKIIDSFIFMKIDRKVYYIHNIPLLHI